MHKRIALLGALLLLSGCQDPGEGGPVTDQVIPGPTVKQFNETFALDVDTHPQTISGLVFAGNECVYTTPDREEGSFRALAGSAILEWEGPAEMNLTLKAEDFTLEEATPIGPSPRRLDFTSLNVTWVDPVVLVARTALPEGTTPIPAQLTLQFQYTGDQPIGRPLGC